MVRAAAQSTLGFLRGRASQYGKEILGGGLVGKEGFLSSLAPRVPAPETWKEAAKRFAKRTREQFNLKKDGTQEYDPQKIAQFTLSFMGDISPVSISNGARPPGTPQVSARTSPDLVNAFKTNTAMQLNYTGDRELAQKLNTINPHSIENFHQLRGAVEKALGEGASHPAVQNWLGTSKQMYDTYLPTVLPRLPVGAINKAVRGTQ